MEDGTLILVAGGLLALGIAASLLAGRLRVPGLLLVLGLGMLLGSDVLSPARLRRRPSTTSSWRARSASSRVALILFEGGLAAGWREIRPVLGREHLAGHARHAHHRRGGGPDRLVAARPEHARGPAAGLDRGLHRQRRDLLGAARVEHRPAAGPHARGRVGLQRPGGDRAGARASSSTSSSPTTASADMLLLSRRRARHRRRRRARSSAGWRCSPSSAPRSRPPASTRWPRSPRRRWPSAWPTSPTARASSPCTWRRLMLGSASIPSRRTVVDFHDGLAWVSQIALFLTLGLLVNPGEFGEIIGEGLLIAGVLMFVARPAGRRDRDEPVRVPPARVGAGGLGRPARRGADRAGHLPGDRRDPGGQRTSSTSSSSWCSPRR